MKILLTSVCKPVPVLLDRYLSIDDVSYRYGFDHGPFSATASVPVFSLHFLAQNISVPSVVLEWPALDELEAELKATHYDYVGITFKSMDLHTVAEMAARIREVSPHTKIVVGGYGTLAIDEPEAEGIRNNVDFVCRHGDGVQFLRDLLGDKEARPRIAHLPVAVTRIPWIPMANAKAGCIPSALGCRWKCEFCSTSAYARGGVTDVMSPEEIHASMQWYYTTHPNLAQIRMIDEDLLLRKDKVDALGKLIRGDERFGLSRMSYLAFGTLKAICLWEPEALLLNGVGKVWAGLESLYSYRNKKGEADSKTLIRGLNEHGIETQLSWILGDDCQTKENIDADVENLIDHAPCTVQLAVLYASPGTPLHDRLKMGGRIRPFVPGESHFLGNSIDSLHFTHTERLQIISETYRRLTETHGPSMMRSTNVFMNGYEHCANSKNPLLNGPRREFFRRKIRENIPFVRVALAFASSPRARQTVLDIQERYASLFGPLHKAQRVAADRLLKMAEREMERRAREGYSALRDVPLKRYAYQEPSRP